MRHHPVASSLWIQELTAAQTELRWPPHPGSTLWRARGPSGAARERAEARGDSAPLSLALAKTAGACGDISCAVTRLAGRCAPLLLRARKEMPFVGEGGEGLDCFF